MFKLLLASNNRGKLAEMQALLDGMDIELLTAAQIGLELEVVEDGQTYAENAALKACAFASASGLLCLADDSGLEVDALDGRPGLHSNRFLDKPNATDADRRAYLLQLLQSQPRPWAAHFHCTVALARPDREPVFADGDCPGEIIPEERGENGFGYDPIFLLTDQGLTMAELSMQAKNQVSHRARAIKAALPILEKLRKS